VIRDALRFFARRFRSNNIVLAEELAVDLPQIFADASRLQQVIVNLIVNAEDAMEEQEEPKEVRVESFAVATDQVGLAISDSGCGIPDEIKEAIFDPFFTTKPPNRGTGLGLSISKSIVEMHGGSILVEPNPQGRGSQFRIALPVLATDAPNANHDRESGTS
jgi:signal transduction histidine kinase